MIDNSLYGQKPVYRVMEVLAKTLLKKDVSQEIHMYLRKHLIETQDKIVNIFDTNSYEGDFFQVGR